MDITNPGSAQAKLKAAFENEKFAAIYGQARAQLLPNHPRAQLAVASPPQLAVASPASPRPPDDVSRFSPNRSPR